MIADYYKHFRTITQIKTILNDFGAKNISVEKGGNGLECRLQKKNQYELGNS